jgi:hypothetical protein
VEVAVEAIHRKKQWLLRLLAEKGYLADVENVLTRPKVNTSVSDIAHEGGALVEGVEDFRSRCRRSTSIFADADGISSERNSTIIVPSPADLVEAFLNPGNKTEKS